MHNNSRCFLIKDDTLPQLLSLQQPRGSEASIAGRIKSIFDANRGQSEQHDALDSLNAVAIFSMKLFFAFLFCASSFIALDLWLSPSISSFVKYAFRSVGDHMECHSSDGAGTRQVWKSESSNCFEFTIAWSSILAKNRNVALIKTDGHLMAYNYCYRVTMLQHISN